jgi:hypothetical protein
MNATDYGLACCLLHRGFSLAYSLTMKMEATYSSETSVDFHLTTRRYVPQDRILPTLCALNLLVENSKMRLGPKRLIASALNNLELLQIYNLVRKIGVMTDP